MSSKTLGILSLLAVVLAMQLNLTGCNTMRGAGQDVSAAGDAIERKAEQKKGY